MSEWGRVVFYYDFERDLPSRFGRSGSGETERITGLISKAYKYPSMLGLIIHAVNGFRYFLDNADDEDSSFDGSLHFLDSFLPSRWEELNTSFDIFWDNKKILLGVDSVTHVVDRIKRRLADGREYDAEHIDNDLYSCEGTDGYMVIRFTGDPVHGHTAKYGFVCGYAGVEEKFMDAKTAAGIYMEHAGYSDEEIAEVMNDELFTFIDEYLEMFDSEDDFWAATDRGTEWIMRIKQSLADEKE